MSEKAEEVVSPPRLVVSVDIFGRVTVEQPSHDPYAGLVGCLVQGLPEVMQKTLLQTVPHLVAAAGIRDLALGKPVSPDESDRRRLGLWGFALRAHGLHLASCIRAGLMGDDEAERSAYLGWAEDLMRCGQAVVSVFLSGAEFASFAHLVPNWSELTKKASKGARELAFAVAGRKFPYCLPSFDVRCLGYGWLKPFGYFGAAHDPVLDHVFSEQGIRRLTHSFGIPAVVGPMARLNTLKGRHRRLDPTFPSNPFSLLGKEMLESTILVVAIGATLGSCSTEVDDATVAPNLIAVGGMRFRSWVEAPRGILCHQVTTDREGCLVEGRVLLPSWQNLWLLERAATEVVLQMRVEGRTRPEMEATLTDLARFYNPCVDQDGDFVEFRWME
ncbi:hypothetical protein COY93_01590 [Candidatus Uhrbacteria bacterium CG_4_10_14_0_8_um_filter_58_22]|uniref:Uncharacterized protein n=1 Tax=Candidatus Uhrbacteria bacterium CG_4_10_14_0_8_um_filter_58_22 TaxID=1975029 RepID=A0A2M7QB75_9BACT|nr:MAG: hypothetical protein AUJ19_03310 [Parcubacteria group bacterium CG1_02_58_44]PIY62977.1 MAG: hypothetical protein COY93_01590 [Candidatus Uhrbacteria bacterium CG_4_10_14_0_8_um_filter_58_22]